MTVADAESDDGLDQFFFDLDQAKTPPVIRRRKRKRPEAGVQKKIVAWLVAHGVAVAVTDAGALARLGLNMRCGIPKGWPDLTCCLPPNGRFMGIEVKAPKGIQDEDQIKWQDWIVWLGGICILAKSVEDVIAGLEKHGITLTD